MPASAKHLPEVMSEAATSSGFSDLAEDRQPERKHGMLYPLSKSGGFQSECIPKAAKSLTGKYRPSSSLPESDGLQPKFHGPVSPRLSESDKRYPEGNMSRVPPSLSESAGPQPGGMYETSSVPGNWDPSSPHAYVNRVFYISHPAEETDGNASESAASGTNTTDKRTWPRHLAIVVGIVGFLLAAASIGVIVFYTTKEQDNPPTPAASQTKSPSVFTHPDRLTLGDFEGSFKVMTKWDPALTDASGDAFKTTASKLTHMIDDIFRASDIGHAVKYNNVTSLREGSIDVVFTTSLKKSSELSDFSNALLAASLQTRQALDLIKDAFLAGLSSVVSQKEPTDDDNNYDSNNPPKPPTDYENYPALVNRTSVIMRPVSESSTTTLTTTSSTTTTTTTTTMTTATTSTKTPLPTTLSSSEAGTTTGSANTSSEGEEEGETSTAPSTDSPPCGVVHNPPTPRIIGGTAAAQGMYPWVVMIGADGDFYCGGSIIDRLHVLTAAHCLDDHSVPEGLYVVAGTRFQDYTPSDDVQKVNLAGFYIHKQYNRETPGRWSSFLNDIALLKLAKPLTFNSRVSAVCLPQANATLPAKCTSAGWGSTTSPMVTYPNELRVVTLDAYNSSRCAQVFGESFRLFMHGDSINYYLSDGVMCAANGTTGGLDTCTGDSGGALFCLQQGEGQSQHYTQFGVVSWGDGCAVPGSPGFYAYLPHFRSWLENTATPALKNATGY